jgi:hypothetical protein
MVVLAALAHAQEVQEREEEEPDQATGCLSAAELAQAQLLGVLASWARCLPEALTAARFDVARLLPQVRAPILAVSSMLSHFDLHLW